MSTTLETAKYTGYYRVVCSAVHVTVNRKTGERTVWGPVSWLTSKGGRWVKCPTCGCWVDRFTGEISEFKRVPITMN